MDPEKLYEELEQIRKLEADEGTSKDEESLREYSFLLGLRPDKFSYEELKDYHNYVVDQLAGDVEELEDEITELKSLLEIREEELEGEIRSGDELNEKKEKILGILKERTTPGAYLLLESEIEKLFS